MLYSVITVDFYHLASEIMDLFFVLLLKYHQKCGLRTVLSISCSKISLHLASTLLISAAFIDAHIFNNFRYSVTNKLVIFRHIRHPTLSYIFIIHQTTFFFNISQKIFSFFIFKDPILSHQIGYAFFII